MSTSFGKTFDEHNRTQTSFTVRQEHRASFLQELRHFASSKHNTHEPCSILLNHAYPTPVTSKPSAFAPNGGWAVLYAGNCHSICGLSSALEDALTELHDEEKDIRQVAFAPDGS